MPPRWIVEPVDINVERNKHTVIDCQAEGVPTPVLLWKKAISKFTPLLYKNSSREREEKTDANTCFQKKKTLKGTEV